MTERMEKIRAHMMESLKMNKILERAGLHNGGWDRELNASAIFKGESTEARCVAYMDSRTLEIRWRAKLDYIYIRAWGIAANRDYEDTCKDLTMARMEGAPMSAIYKDKDGSWKTFEEVKSDGLKEIILIAAADLV